MLDTNNPKVLTYSLCTCICEWMSSPRTRPSSRSRATPVSSQLLSMPRISTSPDELWPLSFSSTLEQVDSLLIARMDTSLL